MNTALKIRLWLIVFIVGLFLSGITVFPIITEVNLLNTWFGTDSFLQDHLPAASEWIVRIHQGVHETNAKYPFLFYGTDWLGFAHIMLAILFIGPLRDPVKNIWIIEFGMIACVLVIPFAFICGPLRGIPLYWTLIDCSFGVVGIVPLLIVRNAIKSL
ncbi:MAG: hypothetical protein ABW044_01930 [Cellvibrio sp.]